jgi:hypothetical protein
LYDQDGSIGGKGDKTVSAAHLLDMTDWSEASVVVHPRHKVPGLATVHRTVDPLGIVSHKEALVTDQPKI